MDYQAGTRQLGSMQQLEKAMSEARTSCTHVVEGSIILVHLGHTYVGARVALACVYSLWINHKEITLFSLAPACTCIFLVQCVYV